MPETRWRVGIIDSGLTALAALPVAAQRRFVDTAARIEVQEPVADTFEHGTRVARIIHGADRPCDLLMAQALDAQGRSTAATIAAAIHWLLSERANLLHLSLGLREDRTPLAQAVAAAVQAGVLIVAASPARGAKPFPACYPGVLAATGDARCTPLEISCLWTPHADFGGCVRSDLDAGPDARGASIGAAHVSRFIVTHLVPGTVAADARAQLAVLSAFSGRERR